MAGAKSLARSRERAVRKRRQLAAISMWLADLANGEDRYSLSDYCRGAEVTPRGIHKLLRSPKVQTRLEEILGLQAGDGLKAVNAKLARRIESDLVTNTDLVRIGAHFAKLRYGGYRKDEKVSGQANVAIQINLPSGFTEEQVKQVQAEVKDTFGDELLE